LHDVEVPARAAGLVTALDAEEGMRVQAGQRLARVDDRERRALLDEREAQAARAEAAWQRAERLHEQKLIAEEAYIAARADQQVALAQRDQARLAWEWCEVRAPIAGLVAERRTQVGRTVTEGDVLFRISDPDWLRAELLLPQVRFGTVRAGQRVRLVPVDGAPAVAATITRVTPLVDPASGAFRVTIDLDNRRTRLPAGITVRVELEPASPR
jgi:RND family efflux transporter MFP subunit